ncbi:MAG TPA: hypothetical protein PKY30_13950, partial [Myxococcota bacterium]|nr:hypothetical protein [Myxococcota bacterium]
MWFLLLACTEYDVISDPKDPAAGEEEEELLPSVLVSPDTVQLGVTCGEGSSTLTVESVGDAALAVENLRFEGGWSADTSELPLLLDPGQSWSVELKGSGEGKARLKTDDPETPLVEIPLSSTANSAPVLTVLTPTSGDVLSSSSTDFTASIADDLDLPESVALSWTSDVDGLLGSDPAGSDGIAHYLWDPAVRSAGNHTTTLTATDSCGAQTSTQVVFCQDQGYSADNLDLATWHFEGNAHWDSLNSWVELTNNSNYQSGTAFQTASTVPANNVVISFSFFVSGGSGADGI